MPLSLFFVILSGALVSAHLAVWNKGMYCLNGTSGKDDQNAHEPTTPLYMLTKDQWWFHHVDGCDTFPPKEGDFLELPAGKDITVEIAANRAVTSLSYSAKYTSDWVDGENYPDNFSKSPGCITTPNMHTQNETMAAGTAFAISYQSDIKKVTAENLVVFTVRYHTPWKRLTTYSVPKALPACPPDGCTCAWGWIPNGCGEPNMYHQAFKCKVTGASATGPVALGKPPVWCEDDPSKCTKGAKQMLYWHQKDGNNIEVSGNDRAGMPKSPAYNSKCGFPDGAQNDIFAPPSQGGGNNNGAGTSSSSASSSRPPSTFSASETRGPAPTGNPAPPSPPTTRSPPPLPPTTSSPSQPTSSSSVGSPVPSDSPNSNPPPPPPPPTTTSSTPQPTSLPSTGGSCSAKKHRKRSSARSGKKRVAAQHRRRRVVSHH